MEIPNFELKVPNIPFAQLGEFDSYYMNIFSHWTALMTDELIWYIASAGYGYEKDVCYKELKKIITTQEFPTNPNFILTECLELTRWTKPKNRNEHIVTGFSAMLLLILEEEADYLPDSENESLITFMNSASNLNINLQYVQEFIVWKIKSDYKLEKELSIEEGELIEEVTIDEFFIYALLLINVFSKQSEQNIHRIADWLLNMDKFNKNLSPYYSKEREEHLKKYNINSEHFLLGLTNHNQRHYLWKEKTNEMLQKTKYLQSEDLVFKISNIANKILLEKV